MSLRQASMHAIAGRLRLLNEGVSTRQCRRRNTYQRLVSTRSLSTTAAILVVVSVIARECFAASADASNAPSLNLPGVEAAPLLAAAPDSRPGETSDAKCKICCEQGFACSWVLGDYALHPKPFYWDVWAPPVASGLVLAAVQFGLEPPRNPRWVGENGFDNGIGDALRAGSATGRNRASTASDALFGSLGAALLADRLIAHERYPSLLSLASDVTWFFSDSITTQVAKVSAGRQRPYVQPCEKNQNYVSTCDDGRDQNASFYSGHASSTATLAGLLCSRHRDLLTWDGLWCVGGISGSLATGMLRIAADRHWATDVITGWAFGATFGFILPTYVWPAWKDWDDRNTPPVTSLAFHLRAVRPIVGPEMTGLGYEMRF